MYVAIFPKGPILARVCPSSLYLLVGVALEAHMALPALVAPVIHKMAFFSVLFALMTGCIDKMVNDTVNNG